MDSSLFLAAREGNVEALRTLLQANPLLLEEATISTSRTPLHIASMLGHIDFVKELIKSKNNVNDYVNELDQNGFSAIHLACANGHRQVITELLVVNYELCNLKGKDGMTPLHCASIKGRVNVITHLLLASLVNVSETNVTKETALHLAVKNNQFRALEVMVDWLKQRNLLQVLNSEDEEGDTVLHLAAARRNYQATKLLLDCGHPQVNAPNKSNLTALDLVITPNRNEYNYDDDIESLLRDYNAKRGRFLTEKSRSRSPPHYPSTREEILNWTDYFKFQFDRSKPDRVRSDLLVVAVLLATATFQGCLSPPGGLNQDDPDKGKAVLAAMPVPFMLFLFFNLLGFSMSMYTILVLTDNFPLYRELQVAVFAIGFSYGTATTSMIPGKTFQIVYAVLCFVLPSSMPFLSYKLREWYKSRPGTRLAYSRQNLSV